MAFASACAGDAPHDGARTSSTVVRAKDPSAARNDANEVAAHEDRSRGATRDDATRTAAREDATLQRLLALARTDNRVQEPLRTLTKTIGPRLIGSQRLARAERWCLEEFQSYGLDARLEKWGEQPVSFDRGASSGRMLSPERVDFEFITLAWTAGTDGAVRGLALLEPETEDELDAMRPKLAGAWIVRREHLGSAKLRSSMKEACATSRPAGYVASGSKSGKFVMHGNHRVKPEALPRDVEVQLRRDQYESLVDRLKAGDAVELEFDVQNRFGPGPIECHNVVADLVGREFPSEYVIVGAHLDSWDGAEGAQDNGAGVATTLEVARLFAKAGVHPRRTVRFVLFGGEEEGLYGSRKYVEDHADSLARTSVVLNHDTGGSHVRAIGATYAMMDDFLAVFAPIMELDPTRPFRVRETLGIENSGDSDHAPFIGAGVPAFVWDQDEDAYERFHHTQYDVFESVDPDEQAFSATVIAVAAYGFAELDHLVSREDMDPIPPRRLGVSLEGTRVERVLSGGKAEASGWQVGDVVVTVNGAAVATRQALTDALQGGDSHVRVVLDRGGTTVETVVDYSSDPDEALRSARVARRAAREDRARTSTPNPR